MQQPDSRTDRGLLVRCRKLLSSIQAFTGGDVAGLTGGMGRLDGDGVKTGEGCLGGGYFCLVPIPFNRLLVHFLH
jgi:hypothetical protein